MIYDFSKKRGIILPIMDIFSAVVGYYLMYFIITDSLMILDTAMGIDFIKSMAIFSIVIVIIFRATHMYTNIIRYENETDYLIYIMLSLLGGAITYVIAAYLLGLANPTFKISLITSFVIGLIIVAMHLLAKHILISDNAKKIESETENLLIIGGGYSANDIIKTLNSTFKGKYNIIGIIDDNKKRLGYSVGGVKIIGTRDDIIRLSEKYDIDLIFFSIVNIDNKNKKEILDICRKTDAKIKVLPGLRELITQTNLYSTLRDVEIEDLLGRDPIELDNNNIRGIVNGKVVLVTGGGGSIGEELCRQIMLHNPKQLVMLDIYENSLYNIELEIKTKYPNNDIRAVIANIREADRIDAIFEKYKPEIVFHAAAHKHVPLMENNPTEAIKNNVFGTNNLINSADRYGAKRFILISTDKAVNPTNIMGASKRLCEMIIQSKDRVSNTEYVAVRFGNVLGSNGSVVPLFKKQIKAGGPLTVTDKEVTRYFMTIPEAVALVLQAITYAKGGEIFVLDMGEPVKIYDLAKSIIDLYGLKLGEDIDIEITGMRPGEKLYEELLMAEENLQETNHEKIFITESMDFTTEEIEEKLSLLSETIRDENVSKDDIKQTMQKCVPTYNPK